MDSDAWDARTHGFKHSGIHLLLYVVCGGKVFAPKLLAEHPFPCVCLFHMDLYLGHKTRFDWVQFSNL